MSSVQVVLPIPSSTSAGWRGTEGTFSVAGKRVALVNNGWGSAEDLVEVFDRLLRDQHDVADVLHYKWRAESAAADERFYTEITESADVAVTLLGNCGGCTAWTCNTSAELERRGLYAAALVTGLFQPLAEFTLSQTNKAPDHPLVVLDDNFEHVAPEQLERDAEKTLETLFGPGSAHAATATATGTANR